MASLDALNVFLCVQRKLLQAQSSWDAGAAAGAQIPKGQVHVSSLSLFGRFFPPQLGMGVRGSKALDWFVAGPALLWHLRCACKAPLADDALAIEVLEHASGLVRAQGGRALPAADIVELAEHHGGMRAAELLALVVDGGEGLSKEERLAHAQRCLAHVDSSNSNAATTDARADALAAAMCWQIQFTLTKPGSPQWCVAFAELLRACMERASHA